ncbi:hypothetical protein [Acidovorax sp. A79]|uniref:hypothetical protein n=1 Tax=Acidovorax sp. A79 TaxID=3056107 RepID=UPI0034E8BDDD
MKQRPRIYQYPEGADVGALETRLDAAWDRQALRSMSRKGYRRARRIHHHCKVSVVANHANQVDAALVAKHGNGALPRWILHVLGFQELLAEPQLDGISRRYSARRWVWSHQFRAAHFAAHR